MLSLFGTTQFDIHMNHVFGSHRLTLILQLIAVLLPIVGLGAFLWWAGRDIVQSTVRLL